MPFASVKRELLHRRRAGLADVVAGDRDRVPGRDPFGAVREQIGRQSHRRSRRKDVVPARDVLLEDVVLHRAAQRFTADSPPLRHELVEEQQQRRGRVDRHRRRDLVERNAVEQDLHVGERVDRDAGAADLACGVRIVGVVPELGRQVERDRQPRLAAGEQVAIALVRLLGRGEPGVLADRPGPAPVHVRVRAARERKLTGRPRAASARRRSCRPASPRCPDSVSRWSVAATLAVCSPTHAGSCGSSHWTARTGCSTRARQALGTGRRSDPLDDVACRHDDPRSPVRRTARARRLVAAGARRQRVADVWPRSGSATSRPACSMRSTRNTRSVTARSRTVTRWR